MKKDKHIEALGRVPLFAGCSRSELAMIGAATTPLDVPSGRALCRQGDVGREAFIIVEGKASVELDGRQIAVLGAGEFFGEMALLDGGPRVATVRADTPMRVLVLTQRELYTVLGAAPNVTKRMLAALGGRLRAFEHPDGLPYGV